MIQQMTRDAEDVVSTESPKTKTCFSTAPSDCLERSHRGPVSGNSLAITWESSALSLLSVMDIHCPHMHAAATSSQTLHMWSGATGRCRALALRPHYFLYFSTSTFRVSPTHNDSDTLLSKSLKKMPSFALLFQWWSVRCLGMSIRMKPASNCCRIRCGEVHNCS